MTTERSGRGLKDTAPLELTWIPN